MPAPPTGAPHSRTLWARARRVLWLTATATVAVVTVLVIVRAVYLLVGLLTLILVALFIAVSLDPAVRWLTRRGLGRPWAVGLIATVMFATVAEFVAAVVPTMIDQGQNLVWRTPRCVSRIPLAGNNSCRS
ncbi:AI-2E family transporter [Longispora urticae]